MIPVGLVKKLEDAERVVVLGLGSEIRGDEVVPMKIIEGLKETDGVHNIWASTRPENFTGEIIDYKPDLILVLQVSSFGGAPGEVRLVSIDEHDDKTLHESPLTTMSHYLKGKIDVDIVLLVIEPKNKMIGRMSDELTRVMYKLTNELNKVLS